MLSNSGRDVADLHARDDQGLRRVRYGPAVLAQRGDHDEIERARRMKPLSGDRVKDLERNGPGGDLPVSRAREVSCVGASGLDAVMLCLYDLHMRTTISLDDRLAEAVRRRAAESGTSVSAFIARILDDSLKRTEPQPTKPFRLVTVGGEGVRRGVDLDRPRELELADDEVTWSGRR